MLTSANKNPVMRHAEDSLQISCVAEFKLRCPRLEIIAIPNGGSRAPKINKYEKRYSPEAQRMKRMGLRPGASDLFFPEPCGKFFGLWIEMKSSVGKMSPEQKDFFAQMRGRGYWAEMANSRESFWDIVCHYFKIPLPHDIEQSRKISRRNILDTIS